MVYFVATVVVTCCGQAIVIFGNTSLHCEVKCSMLPDHNKN